MSWRDSLRPGSFRGAAFKIQSGDGEGGRRGEMHEFPERDLPWFEDLGRAAKRWSIEAIVVGPDYMAARDKLITALDVRGPGTLIHPFLGTLTVVAPTYRYRESTAEGGMASFTIDFAEAGRMVAPAARSDSAAIAEIRADDAILASPPAFAASFTTAGVPQFVESEAVKLVRRTADAATQARLMLGGNGPALRAFEAGLSALPRGALALVRQPLALGHAVAGLVIAVGGLGSSALARVAALRRLMGNFSDLPAVLGSTPARRRQRANQAAFERLVSISAAAEAVRATAAVRFASYDEAVALRDAFADELDAVAVRLADAGDDIAASQVDTLRLAMVRDVTSRGGSLARLSRYAPRATEPVLVIGQRLYGEPELVLAEAAAIVARNRIRHPGFVAGGVSLEVRANG